VSFYSLLIVADVVVGVVIAAFVHMTCMSRVFDVVVAVISVT